MAEVDIIELWNKGKKISPADEPNLDEVITKKSKTPLYWIKVILWIEFTINLVSLPFVFIYKEIDPVLYGVFMPIVIVIYLVYYQFLIQKINRFDYTQDVKTGLKKLYNYLNFFFLHYKVIIWVSLVFGYIYGLLEAMEETPVPEGEEQRFWLIAIGAGIILLGAVGMIFTVLINLIYGRKIKRLRGIVRELEEAENETI